MTYLINMLSALGVGDTSGSSSANSSGQSLEDKLYAVKYFISGQCLSFVVLKATTSEILGPKRKHLNYLVNITNEPNVSIPDLVKYLMRRARHDEWSVVFKSLITIHYLMSYGNERFFQNLASSTVYHITFECLSSFVDRTTTRAYDMSTFVRRYSRYVSVKIHTYRSLGMDFCKIKTSSQSPLKMREMQPDQLLKTLPILQNQFDTLLAFDASARDLNNGIINSAFALLYKDFVKLYICYQAVIIRLLEIYFKINQVKKAQGLLQGYKKFLVRMDKVSDFMRVIDSVGIDKSDMPNLSRSPNLPLGVLEKHLAGLESATLSRRNYQSVNEVPKIRNDYVTLSKPKRPNEANYRYKFQLSPASTFHMNNSMSNSLKSAEVQKKQNNTPLKLTDSDIEKLATYDKRKTKVESCDTSHDYSSIYSADSSKTQENSRYIEDLFLDELTETSKSTDKQESEKKNTGEDKIDAKLAGGKDESEDLILMFDADDEKIPKSETVTEIKTSTTNAISTDSSRRNRNNITDKSDTSNTTANKPTKVGTYSDWVQVEL